MHVGTRRSRERIVFRLVALLAPTIALVLGTPVDLVLAQIDPRLRDRVVPAIVEIAIEIDATENRSTEARYLPVSSGTTFAPNGLILANYHVIDVATLRDELDVREALTFDLHGDPVLMLRTDGDNLVEQLSTEDEPQKPPQEPAVQVRQEATPPPDACEGFDTYLDAVRVASKEYHVAVEEDGLADAIAYPLNPEAQATLTSPEWIKLAKHDEALMAAFKAIDPPPGAVSWHEFQIELIAFQSAFDRSAATLGFETTARLMHKVSAKLVKRQERERIAAVEACPGFTVLYPDLARPTLTAPTGTPEPPPGQATPDAGTAEDDSLVNPQGTPESISAEDEASCATGPIYSPGTDLVVVHDTVLQTPTGDAEQDVPAGTLVRTTGEYVENGVCDLWPVSVVSPMTLGDGLIDERVLAPTDDPA